MRSLQTSLREKEEQFLECHKEGEMAKAELEKKVKIILIIRIFTVK